MATSPAIPYVHRNRHFPRFAKSAVRCPIHGCKMKEVTLPMPKFASSGEGDFMNEWRLNRKAYRCTRKGCPRVEMAQHTAMLSDSFRVKHKLTFLEY